MADESEAISLLGSTAPHDRLKGARYFGKHKSSNVLPTLQKCLQEERVGFVKTALLIAIKHQSAVNIENSVKDHFFDEEQNFSEEMKRQLFARAVDQVAGMLLHELEPKIGLLKVAAFREVENFESSSVKKHLESLDRSFTGITNLREAAATPRAKEFDLAQVVADIVVEESGGSEGSFYYHGSRPFLIIGDPNLLTLAISNGVRNAIEAVSQYDSDDKKNIVIDWGQTDVDYWLTVLDNGPGISGSSEAAFEIGKTNKPGHGGFGLAIVKEAMENLGGGATIEPAQNGGALLQLRWGRLYERDNAGSGR